jgi:short-subunit dehydrogenase
MKQYALITGASQGLGKAFVKEISKKKINTILVSLPDEGLSTFCEELEELYGVDSICYETDLSIVENVVQLTKWINSEFEVFVLINNAGIGGSKKITEADLHYIEKMLQLNVVATTILIHQLLPNLLRQPKAHIYNISSLAAFFPIGCKTV